jgi:hypothetical protein
VAALAPLARAALAAAALVGAIAPWPAAAQESHLLLVVGLGGDPAYEETFHAWATTLRAAALDTHRVPAENVVYLGEGHADHPGVIQARATKENLGSALAALSARAGERDRILVVLIGHGTSREGEVSFNLPGPDVTAGDLDVMLRSFPTQTVAVVNTSPSSGPFVQALSGPGRMILTATKTALERNATQFGQFFVEAFSGDGSDLDKDGRISLLEAFEYTRREVERYYQENNLLLTEHALLDDNGDGQGSTEPGVDAADGRLARTFWLGTTAAADGAVAADIPEGVTDPELLRLYRERAVIEGRIEELRLLKDRMEEARYERELEDLLVELALKNREIRARGGPGS